MIRWIVVGLAFLSMLVLLVASPVWAGVQPYSQFTKWWSPIEGYMVVELKDDTIMIVWYAPSTFRHKQGIRKWDVMLEGVIKNNKILAVMSVNRPNCEPVTFKMFGWLDPVNSKLGLTGISPIINENCKKVGGERAKREFEYVETFDASELDD